MTGLRLRLATTSLVLPALLGAACGGSDSSESRAEGLAWIQHRELMAVEIVVDLLAAGDGRIPIELTAIGGRPTHFAIQSAWSDGYAIHDLRFTDAEGRPVAHHEERGRYRVEPAAGDVITAAYVAELGGEGRHGMQGVVARDHVMFDGRLFLLPQGAVPIGAARIRFLAPEDWTVGSPFREERSWYYVDAFEPKWTAKVLGASCMGVGRFDQLARPVGATEVRVASYADWDEEHKQLLADHSFRVFEYFHDTLGFDLRAPYSVVWVPKQGRDRVLGGSFANGTCYENPTGRTRNWELLAHRIAHAMNHYRPSGMRIRDDEDSWFNEGWASYMEAVATRGTGLAEPGQRWNTLHRSYRRAQLNTPELDIPLSREKQARDETKEYLHYVKAPLVVKMLEYRVRVRSGHDLEQFMNAMWDRYGWYEQPFPFRQELEAFTGESYGDFWALMVRSRGHVVPVWDEYLTPGRLRTMERAPAATVGDVPLQGDYLYYLATSGDFRSFGAIRRFLVREVTLRQELVSRRIRLYPEKIRDHLYALDPEDRYAVARLEAAYARRALPKPSGSAGGEAVSAAPAVVPDTSQEDGRIFAELLALEERAETPDYRGAGPWIEARTERPPGSGRARARLGFEDGQPIELVVSRLHGVESARIELSSEGGPATERTLDATERLRLQTIVEPEQRPAGSRVILLRLVPAGGAPVARAFWQRSAGRWVPLHPVSPEEE